MKSKQIEVYISLNFNDIFVGNLFVEILRGKEIYSFEYDDSYLELKKPFQIDPELFLIKGRQYKTDSSVPFGFVADAIPDRWGKNLLNRQEKTNAKLENRLPELLGDSDYLLRVNDYTRQGALRFKIRGHKEFMESNRKESVPSLLFINKIEQLAYNIDIYNDEEIKDLFSPGSSLGGARPKATIFDNEGNLFIAKFSHKRDEYNIPKMELLVNRLAVKCGLNVPECRLISGEHSIFLSKRFDRELNKRIPYISCMTLLNAKDGDNESYSYLDLVDLISKNSINPKTDLIEMFKRLVFNCIIHNGDDHLRNHGFILKTNGWQLSPLFDINPNPDSLGLTLSIDGFEHSFNFDNCVSVAKYFGLNNCDAKKIVEEMKNIVKLDAYKMAKEIGVDRETIERFDYFLKKEK